MSERHREALAHLLYGIKSDGGFILLTGEVGTGKTTVCRCLLAQMPEDVDTAFVLNPKQTAAELLATICDDLRVEHPAQASIKVLVDRLNDFLLASHRQGRRTVLIIDEAQNLSIDVLEQLRLLTNLETDQRKLLQIILLGQPELLDMLERSELRQLAQRVTARFHLDALSKQEVAAYIRHRLDVAGCKEELFRPAAVSRVYALSGGVPRLINLICDRSLLGAYAKDRRQVDRNIVNRAAAEIFGHRSAAGKTEWLGVAAAAAALAVAVSGGYFIGHGVPVHSAGQPAVTDQAPAPALQPGPATTAAADAGTPAGDTAQAAPAADDASTGPADAGSPVAPVTTAVAQPVAGPHTDALINVEGDDSAEAAMAHLFALWGMPLHGAGTPPCEQAAQFGLSCMTGLGSLRDLDRLDRPAVIDLSIAGIDNFLAVAHIDGDIVGLVSGKGKFRLKESDLIRSWDGHFAILWKPPPNYREIQRGDKGATVDWLYRQLAIIEGQKADPVVGRPFDAELEDRLKRFQITQGLRPDGIAGAYTWIRINNLVDRDVPRLSAASGG